MDVTTLFLAAQFLRGRSPALSYVPKGSFDKVQVFDVILLHWVRENLLLFYLVKF